MELIDKRCRCGNLMHNVSPRQQICEECKKKKIAQAKAMTKSLQAEDAARRARRPQPKSQPFKSIEQCVREADALGISHGQYVARGLDQVV
ncbi:hypothetical protein [Subdoligranulum variabile]|uniref:hypothetical protein n=1 Tax=Subdoligranulum variabile TaxID=214851 RepID=UPI0026E9B773|nr:hypothetical protein [Subdoligranulum variabile]